jgi:glyoxylase-like metal-dependent hydrolase (beta-lactamase superfamily II)
MKRNLVEDIEIIELPTDWPVGPVNLFLIKGEKLTLVDAGRRLEKAWVLFKLALERKGYSIMDIDQVVLTHHHTDHVGMLDWLLEANPVPVYAHANCRPYLSLEETHFTRAMEFFKTFFHEQGVPNSLMNQLVSGKGGFRGIENKVEIIQELNEGDTIPGLPEWKVIETKGHSQSHISLYRSRDQVFLSGDHLIKHTPAGIFLDPPIYPEMTRSKPLIQYIENLKKCLTFPISVTFSGHGEPIDDVVGLIEKTLNNIDKRAQKVKNVLLDSKKSAYQIVRILYPDRYEHGITVLLSDAVSLLDLLIERNEISQVEEDGVIYYSIRP